MTNLLTHNFYDSVSDWGRNDPDLFKVNWFV